jgi:GAF domain-containing protein
MEETSKKEKYEDLIALLKSYRQEGRKPEKLTLFSHVVNILKNDFPYMDWVGFYLKETNEDVLFLGPYIGEPGCDLIPFSKGVCGRAASLKTTQMVRDVSKISYHIACSSKTESEIVIPLFKSGQELIGVLDVDSNALAAFDKTDEQYLKSIAYLLAE